MTTTVKNTTKKEIANVSKSNDLVAKINKMIANDIAHDQQDRHIQYQTSIAFLNENLDGFQPYKGIAAALFNLKITPKFDFKTSVIVADLMYTNEGIEPKQLVIKLNELTGYKKPVKTAKVKTVAPVKTIETKVRKTPKIADQPVKTFTMQDAITFASEAKKQGIEISIKELLSMITK